MFKIVWMHDKIGEKEGERERKREKERERERERERIRNRAYKIRKQKRILHAFYFFLSRKSCNRYFQSYYRDKNYFYITNL